MLTFAVAAYILYNGVFATPTGAPKCSINEKGITAGMGAPNPALGYTVTPARSADGSISFTIGNTAGLTKYQGILMYVTSGTDNLTHIGSFALPDQAKFKFQDAAICGAAKIKGDVSATVTHAAPAPVDFSKPFVWKASPQEMQLPSLALNVVIAQKKAASDEYPQWQHLSNIPIVFGQSNANSTPPPSTGYNGNYQGGAPRKIIKCYPKNMQYPPVTPPAGTDIPKAQGYGSQGYNAPKAQGYGSPQMTDIPKAQGYGSPQGYNAPKAQGYNAPQMTDIPKAQGYNSPQVTQPGAAY
ncbi:hypothetical protein HK103_002624 [Boothiomyces macroporosus]|uniref:Reelin domain-containing protein n=1 Tax=Boothiomyces macroporosus TaxID=261099 RepID=A0AAD5Y6F4_9FUNG|nr:hypothetical protein HK103_002624 [Boothiomyces macroporosus]